MDHDNQLPSPMTGQNLPQPSGPVPAGQPAPPVEHIGSQIGSIVAAHETDAPREVAAAEVPGQGQESDNTSPAGGPSADPSQGDGGASADPGSGNGGSQPPDQSQTTASQIQPLQGLTGQSNQGDKSGGPADGSSKFKLPLPATALPALAIAALLVVLLLAVAAFALLS